MAFVLLPPPVYHRGNMEAIKIPPGNKHITFGALGVGLVTLLPYRKCVLHVVVQKMDP